ncbi:MAG: hypothetical protein NT129_00355 [Candidatus Aenigmarchaeota archaeon]|nr:hypothetical protein [Candidatus Aenigmarchaeota archaeon]
MVKESELWPKVEKFVKSHFGCFVTEIDKGLMEFGKPDVAGVKRFIKDEGSTNEVIVVEVKNGSSGFCKKVGQALGYSIFAHRCYLAVYFKNREKFSEDQKSLANKLGVGLIEIRKNCREILTSPFHEPMEHFLLPFIDKLGVAKCVICNNFFEIKSQVLCREDSIESRNKSLQKAINKDKSYKYFLFNLANEIMDKRSYVYTSRCICSDCIKLFGKGMS